MTEAMTRVLLVSFNVAGHDSLALAYLKAYALKTPEASRSTQIEILGLSHEETSVREGLFYIGQFKPDIIGFSCYCWSMQSILELARSVRQIMPHVTILAGGPEVGPRAEPYLAENEALDVVVHDEGEAAFLDLINHYRDRTGSLNDIPGISFRRGGEIITNPIRPPIERLDEIPSPYLTGILAPKDRITYLQTFRGCPYRCGFCYEGGRHRKLRFFSYDRIKAEIDLVMRNPQIESFHFVDSVFNLNEKHLTRITDLLHDANRHGTQLRTIEVVTELVDEETVRRLRLAGVQSVETGPQTANSKTQKRIGRYFDSGKFARGVRLMLKGGIEVWCDLIIGLPGDNFFRWVATVAYTLQLGPTRVVPSILHVLPGTRLFEEADSFGLAFDPVAPHYVLASDTFPFDQIYRAVLFTSSVAKEHNVALPPQQALP